MTPAALADLVRSHAGDVLTRRGIDPAVLPATVTVRRPRDPAHGDYATGVALQAAPKAGVAAVDLAGWLAEALAAAPQLRSAHAVAPGFVNLRLAPEASAQVMADVVAEVLAAGSGYGAEPASAARLARQVGDLLDTADVWVGRRRTSRDELAGTLGTGTARFAVVHESGRGRRGGRRIEIDPALWSTRDDRNPVYPVQYAHARLCSVIRNAADLGIEADTTRLATLDHPREGELAGLLGELPRTATTAATRARPAQVARYLERLAAACRLFVETCPVLPVGDEDPGPRHAARLALARAARQVLANGMGLLGVTALEQL